MTDLELILATLRRAGKQAAEALQAEAPSLTGTEIIAQEYFIPDFNPARQYLNFRAGYVCKSSAGNVVRLIQPYDSTIYTGQPEELPAQWGFYWSTDPKKAKPFIKSAESPYSKGDCCTFEGRVWRSTLETANVYSPAEYPRGWEDLGLVEDIL